MRYALISTILANVPQAATPEEIERWAAQRGYRAEVMTDQVDVYRDYYAGRRKVATYMAGA